MMATQDGFRLNLYSACACMGGGVTLAVVAGKRKLTDTYPPIRERVVIFAGFVWATAILTGVVTF